MTLVLMIMASAALSGLAAAAIVSVREGEPRAARVLTLLAVLLGALYAAVALLDFTGRGIAAWILSAAPIVLLLLWLIPTRGPRHTHAEPRHRIDERTIMFARMMLKPGTTRFDAYYREFPGHREVDDRWRAKPGLLGEDSLHHHPWLFAAAETANKTIEPLHELVDGVPGARRSDADPAALTRFISGWLLKIGAVSVGVTETRPEHWYTLTGRRDPYGVPAELTHPLALAFTVEMDKDMMDRAPKGPVIVESTQQYLTAATLAVQAAVFLRSLGFAARAHIDTNYRVVCPLVARDAGLGEIGRMGLLMTPELGPRVRIGVVTTDAPLVPSEPTRDESVLDFCAICEKCADVCPSAAIPLGPRQDVDSVTRWRIDQEACFGYWCTIGTDCGRCVQVCPYSHPENPMHRIVRTGVKRSALFRRVALRLDDLFYGRRPSSRPLLDWMNDQE